MVNLKSIIWVFTWSANRLNTPKKKIFRVDCGLKKTSMCLLCLKYKYTDWIQNNRKDISCSYLKRAFMVILTIRQSYFKARGVLEIKDGIS